jgi:hypothetical protein
MYSRYIFLPFRVFYGYLEYFMIILVYFPVLVCCNKTNLATLVDITTQNRDVGGPVFYLFF